MTCPAVISRYGEGRERIGAERRSEGGDEHEGGAGEVALDVGAEVGLCVGRNDRVGVKPRVVENGVKRHAARGEGLKRKDRVVDRSELAVGDERYRQISLAGIVDRQHAVGERHHQSARSLYKHRIVGLGQTLQRGVDRVEVDLAPVDSRCEMRRCGIAEYLRRCSQVGILRQGSAGNAPVDLDVL